MKATFIVVVLISFACVTGCKSSDAPKTGMNSGPAVPATTAEINAAKLQNAIVPEPVQTSFGRDYPGASINTIEVHNTSAGDSFYQITFIRQGAAGVARYFATGAALPAN